MIIDSHAHIASWPTIEDSERMILESQIRYGVAFSLVSDCDCSEFPSITKYGIHHVDQVTGLKVTLDFVKAFPSRLGALLWINPNKEVLTPELIGLIEKNRPFLYGMKVHPYESHLRITSPKMLPYLALARKYHLPLLVHTASDPFSDIRFLGQVASSCPDLIFIAAHLELYSKDSHRAAIEVLKTHPNIYADTAWVDMATAKKVLLHVGEKRILFGTDNPVDGAETLSNPMYQAYFHNKTKLPSRQFHDLMARNAIDVYRLPF